MPHSKSARAHDLSLVVAVESLFVGHDVLYVGEPSDQVVERLAGAAHSVKVVSTSAVESHRLPRNVEVIPALNAILSGVHFDAIVVPDLADASVDTPAALSSLKRSLKAGGSVTVGSYHPGAAHEGVDVARALSYDAFCDLVEAGLGDVRVFGQTHFQGTAIAAFDLDSEPPVVFDGSVVGDRTEAPFRFVAVHAATAHALDGYAVVQLPSEPDVELVSSSEIDALHERLRNVEPELTRRRAEQQTLLLRIESLEKTLGDRTAALTDIDAEADRLRLAIKATKDESDTRSQALQHARRELEKLRSEPPASDDDLRALEEHLREAGKRIQELQAEVERRGVLARDLVEELNSVRRGQVDAAQGVFAEAEAQMSAMARHIHSLEAEILKARAEREQAVERALLSEAARVEAQFRADEFHGHFEAEKRARAEEDERTAELLGRGRGLEARIAELEAAAIASTHNDANAARAAQLEGALNEAREAYELALSRAAGAERRDLEAREQVRELRAERDGMRARLNDREIAIGLAAKKETTQKASRTRIWAEIVGEARNALRDVLSSIDTAARVTAGIGPELTEEIPPPPDAPASPSPRRRRRV